MRKAASSAMTSASVEECDVADCFLHNHIMGTKVRGPNRHKYAPVVDLESRRSAAKLGSTNIARQHASMSSPIQQVWTNSFVWCSQQINRSSRLSHATVHLVTSLANVLTDQSRSARPMRAKYRILSTIFAASWLKCPLVSKSVELSA